MNNNFAKKIRIQILEEKALQTSGMLPVDRFIYYMEQLGIRVDYTISAPELYNTFIDRDVLRRQLFRYPFYDSTPGQSWDGIIPGHKEFTRLLSLANSIDPDEREFREVALKKYTSPQGGNFSLQQLLDTQINYYLVPRVTYTSTKRLRKFLQRRKDMFASLLPLAWQILSVRQVWASYKLDVLTSAGVTSTDKRQYYANRLKCITALDDDGAEDAITKVPPIGGLRFKDSKMRGIYNAPLTSYYLEMKYLGGLFNSFKKLHFDHHYSDKQLEVLIQTLAPVYTFGGDFVGMDFHVTLNIALEVLEFLNEIARPNLTEREFNKVKVILTHIFNSPLILGPITLFGEHSELSGEGITHDLENLISVCINLAWCSHFGFEVVTTPTQPLKSYQAFVIVNGDDVSILCGRTVPLSEANKVYATYARMFGQEVNKDKSDSSVKKATFCKRKWPLRRGLPGYKVDTDGFAISKYSIEKAINALYHPEELPHFTSDGMKMTWLCAIMDCAYGHSRWKAVVSEIVRLNQQWLATDEALSYIFNEEDRQELNRDWWFKNYAQFDLPSSRTFNYIKYLLKKD